MRRGGIAIAVGAVPTFGAVVGYLVPLMGEGGIEPASETASLNLGADRSCLRLAPPCSAVAGRDVFETRRPWR